MKFSCDALLMIIERENSADEQLKQRIEKLIIDNLDLHLPSQSASFIHIMKVLLVVWDFSFKHFIYLIQTDNSSINPQIKNHFYKCCLKIQNVSKLIKNLMKVAKTSSNEYLIKELLLLSIAQFNQECHSLVEGDHLNLKSQDYEVFFNLGIYLF